MLKWASLPEVMDRCWALAGNDVDASNNGKMVTYCIIA
jgi:hypothetical protein